MKKILLSMGLMLAALTLTNCSNEIDENINANTDGVAFELTADIDTDRAATNSYNIKWEKGDALNLYHAVAGTTTYTNDAKFAIDETDITAGRFTGKLGGELTAEAYDWYAFYPYSEYVKAPTGASYYKLWAQNQVASDTDDQLHIAKSNNPLYGVAKGVSATAPLAITMKPLGTMLKINLINVSDEDLEVSSVSFATTSCKITGSYNVNFTGTTPVVTKSDDNYTYNNVNLTFSCGAVLAMAGNAEGDCQVFAAVAPFTAPAGEVLTVTVATNKGNVEVKKTLSAATEFKPGVVNTINVEMEAVEEVCEKFPYTETFATSLGKFTTNNVSLASGLSYVWNWDSNFKCAKGSAYAGSSKAAESWLVSPLIDLTSAKTPVLVFDHAANYFNSAANLKNDIKLMAREKGGEWEELTIPVWTEYSGFKFVNSDQVDLSKYAGKKAQIAFKYTSTTSRAGTYEIQNLKVCEAFFTMTATAPAELPNTAGTGSFDLTVKNAEGYTFTAALKDATQTWISNIAVANNTVSYSVTANTGNVRSAIVVVTATNGTTTQKVEVAISQAASASAVQPVTETLNMPTIFSNTKTELTDGTTYNWGGFNVTFTKLNSSTTNYSGGTSGQLRWYKSDILKFAHKDGYKITKIVFTAVSGYVNKPTADSGSVSVSGTTITWTGDAAAVTLTASSGQIRFTQIAITYIPEGDGSGDEPETSEPVQLATPSVTATANGTTVSVSWGAIANASSYDVTVGDEKKNVTGTSVEFVGLSAGTYEVSVIAKGDGTNYTDSAKGTKSVTVVEQQQGDDSTAEVYTLEGKNVTNASAYTTSEQSFTATDGSVWKILGYFKNTTDILQHGAKSNNYILTPACTNDIETITLTCSGSYYIALWDPSTNKLIPNMVKQNTTSGSAGNGTLTFTLPAGYKQVKIISTRTAAGTGITTSNAATYIKKIVVTSK